MTINFDFDSRTIGAVDKYSFNFGDTNINFNFSEPIFIPSYDFSFGGEVKVVYANFDFNEGELLTQSPSEFESFNFGTGIPEGGFTDFDFHVVEYDPDYDFNFGYNAPTYNILTGNSNFVSIYTDNTADLNSGKIYAASTGEGTALLILDTSVPKVIDSYTKVKEGNYKETLLAEDITDINITIF